MLEIIGWIGSICFSICAVPQAYQSYRDKHSNGISWAFLYLWLIGEIGTIAYVLPTFNWPLLTNYACNLLCLLVIFYYKVFAETVDK